MKAPLTRRTVLVNGTLGVLLTGGAALAYVSLGEDGAGGTTTTSRTVTVARGDLSADVSASGAIASSRTGSLAFSGSGTIKKVYVRVGQKVKKGQKLAALDPTEAQENLDLARANLSVAADADTTTSQGYAQYVQAKNAYDSAQRAVTATVLRAPFTGTVTAVNGAAGQNSGSAAGSTGSSTQSALIELADTTRLEVDGSFTEADTTKLKVGQTAAITFDALAGVTAAGKVTSIGTTATTTSNVVSYTVVVKLTKPPAKIRIGQTSTVTVTTAARKGVLYVPAAAVRTVGGASTVTVLENGEPVSRTVTIGISGDAGTEIVEGLNEGDQVQIVTQASTGTNNSRFPGGGPGGGGFGGGGLGGGGAVPRAGTRP
ncbi:efflux RND transporter periplasmic adaptor subunit [Actinocorallia longicatena]